MKDPFPIAPIPWLQQLVQPAADYLSMPTLPLHIHEVLISAAAYGFIYYPLSPILSRIIAPGYYNQLSRPRRLMWDAHVVSFIQSCLINYLALWVMFSDEERGTMTWEERVWGYTGALGMIQAMAQGYFLWDFIITIRNMDVFGLGTLAHAISALTVFSLGFRPFLNYYAVVFILWELSTPFLNIHWFLDKMNMTGSSIQLYNGLVLIAMFFSCRLVYGTYQSFQAMRDIYSAVNGHPTLPETSEGNLMFATETSTVPMWLGVSYLLSNITLNSLNFYWFVKMIQAVTKRFSPATQEARKRKVEPSSSLATGTDKSALRKRLEVKGAPEEEVSTEL